ncbi:hypothetical protein M422DRAFT_30456 [Sphaerobolus stellatus SS14]|uniref:CDP-diacylglycerol--glycerol-3-phosphate 3-phosphatidyltransferase n=1 Tax=Sphaerobolus stellatus (strain SS14) TaxID=990650 RepID=A0A0C9VBG5_SPHS4|nr:hypothetical protein M422DRAFT_30456 [Sphaerobolus stellatus SS14]
MTLSRFVATLPQPCIPIRGRNVRILQSPVQFYRTILDMIGRAKQRIFLSSLYIGTSEKELLQSLRDSLRQNPQLHVYLNLDLLRSTRPGPASTASILTPLLASFPERVHVNLYKSPKLCGILSRVVPRRFDEGWGTWHAKIYGVDDEVILSGANLNKSYFTNRQDRYLHFTASGALASYCFDFLQLFSKVSYRLGIPEDSSRPYALHWPNNRVQQSNLGTPAAASITQFQASRQRPSITAEYDTLLIPMIQAGYMNVREEEICMASLFSFISNLEGASKSIVDLTSGYFALHKPYQDYLISSPAISRIIAAGPRANGFYGSKGISGRIPEAYTLLERRFWNRVKSASKDTPQISPKIELSEWERENWTYHAKGIWYRPRDNLPPGFTMFGSTNLNSRSANLDTELSFFMVTEQASLQEELYAEIHNLRNNARVVDEEDWMVPERRVRIGTRALVAAGVEGML